MRPTKTLAFLFSFLAIQAAEAQEAAANGLTPHLGTLWMVLYILGGVLLALIVWEVLDRPRAVTMDAGLAAPKEIDNDYIDPTKIKFAEPSRPAAAPAPSFSPPSTPEPARSPMASQEAPSRMAPPPPPASSGDEDNPFRKLSKLGGEEDSPLATPRPPIPRSEPAAVPVAPPAASSSPSGMDSGASSGGWADLLQRVRAGEPSSEDSGKLTPRSVAPPSTEEEAPSSSAAWESLLKKSVNDLGAAPDTTTVGGDFSPRGAIKLGGGQEEKAPVDPLRMALDNPSTDPEENLPDFVKKATRTIALDLKKGGEQTPPPPMPKTEG